MSTLALLLGLPVFHEDIHNPRKHDQLTIIADAIDSAASTPSDRAYLITFGWFETGFSLRVHEGVCRKWECDHGLARSSWQVHRNGMPLLLWEHMRGTNHTEEQVSVALTRIHDAIHACGNNPEAVSSFYMGAGCKWRSDATKLRADFYQRALGKL